MAEWTGWRAVRHTREFRWHVIERLGRRGLALSLGLFLGTWLEGMAYQIQVRGERRVI